VVRSADSTLLYPGLQTNQAEPSHESVDGPMVGTGLACITWAAVHGLYAGTVSGLHHI